MAPQRVFIKNQGDRLFIREKSPCHGRYKTMFNDPEGKQLLVEASPNYFDAGPETVEQIRILLPDAHIVILLRDPIDKFHAQFCYQQKATIFPQSLTVDGYVEQLLSEGQSVEDIAIQSLPWRDRNQLLCGLHYQGIEHWFTRFSRQQISGIFFEDFIADPRATLLSLLSRHSLSMEPYAKRTFEIQNDTWGYKNARVHTLARTAHRRWEPFFRRHYRLKTQLRRVYRRWNGTLPNSTMAPDTVGRLRSLYSDDMNRTRDFLVNVGYTDAPNWLSSKYD